MRPIITAAITLGLGACSPHYFTASPAWQPYFQAVRAGRVQSVCDNAARNAPGRMAIVLTEDGKPHMVAIDALGYVTDNRLPGGAFWWQLPYLWVTEER